MCWSLPVAWSRAGSGPVRRWPEAALAADRFATLALPHRSLFRGQLLLRLVVYLFPIALRAAPPAPLRPMTARASRLVALHAVQCSANRLLLRLGQFQRLRRLGVEQGARSAQLTRDLLQALGLVRRQQLLGSSQIFRRGPPATWGQQRHHLFLLVLGHFQIRPHSFLSQQERLGQAARRAERPAEGRPLRRVVTPIPIPVVARLRVGDQR